MASLQNEQIDQSYQGLIKTANNQAGAPFPPAALQYGDGTDTPIAIGDGTSIGIGDIVTLTSGTRSIDLNSNNLALTGLTFVDGAAGTVGMINGAFEFGAGFPGAPATSVDFTNATVTGLPSGAAGLENGTGTDSLQSAAALTTNAADAAGNGSIAIGDGASATRQESVAIGQGAEANGAGSEGSIAIGHGSIASSNRGIAIGINGTTNSSEGIVIGDDVDISGSDRSVAIGGAITLSGGSDKVAIGTSAAVSGNRGLAFGQNASATGREAIAMGYNVTAAKAETLSVKALETQTNSTPTAGGIIMADAGGTERRLNIDASGGLQVDSTPVGGGGGSVSHPARYFGSGNLTTTFEGPYTFFSNDILFYAVHLQQGEEVTELAVELGAAFTNTTSIGMALYDSQIGTATVEYVPNNKLLDLGTANPSTIGVKTFTGSTYTATYTGTYFIALGYNGQWDGTFRQTESNIRSYQADTYFIANTTLGFARDVNIFEPIRYAGSYNDSMPATFAASQSFSNTSARLAVMGKTAQNI